MSKDWGHGLAGARDGAAQRWVAAPHPAAEGARAARGAELRDPGGRVGRGDPRGVARGDGPRRPDRPPAPDLPPGGGRVADPGWSTGPVTNGGPPAAVSGALTLTLSQGERGFGGASPGGRGDCFDAVGDVEVALDVVAPEGAFEGTRPGDRRADLAE